MDTLTTKVVSVDEPAELAAEQCTHQEATEVATGPTNSEEDAALPPGASGQQASSISRLAIFDENMSIGSAVAFLHSSGRKYEEIAERMGLTLERVIDRNARYLRWQREMVHQLLPLHTALESLAADPAATSDTAPQPRPPCGGPTECGEARRSLVESNSPYTIRSYEQCLRYWEAWYGLRFERPFTYPVLHEVVYRFIEDHASFGRGRRRRLPKPLDQRLVDIGVKRKLGRFSFATVRQQVNVLSSEHTRRGLASPCAHHSIQEAMDELREREDALRDKHYLKKRALGADAIQKVVSTIDDSLIGLRDRALILFAWSTGGRSGSELITATFENTKRVGKDEYRFHGAGCEEQGIPIRGIAAQALSEWIEAAHIYAGPLFRPLTRGGRLSSGPLTDKTVVGRIVKQRCADAGLDPQEFSALSLRYGFAAEALRNGRSLRETVRIAGFKSTQSVRRYQSAVRDLKKLSKMLDTVKNGEVE